MTPGPLLSDLFLDHGSLVHLLTRPFRWRKPGPTEHQPNTSILLFLERRFQSLESGNECRQSRARRPNFRAWWSSLMQNPRPTSPGLLYVTPTRCPPDAHPTPTRVDKRMPHITTGDGFAMRGRGRSKSSLLILAPFVNPHRS